MTAAMDLAPLCPRCRHRHLETLPCWGGRLVAELRSLTFELWGDDCWLCSRPGADTVDHVVSRARGGDDRLENLRPAHGFCNTGRGAGALSTPSVATDAAVLVDERSPRW